MYTRATSSEVLLASLLPVIGPFIRALPRSIRR